MNVRANTIIQDFSYALGDILQYSPDQCLDLYDNFKRNVAYRMISSVSDVFSAEDKKVMKALEQDTHGVSQDDPRLSQLQHVLRTSHSNEELERLAKTYFFEVLDEYIQNEPFFKKSLII